MNNKECIFCKIAKKQMPSDMVYEDDKVVAFTDINPKAPVHILIVPKKHIETIDHAEKNDRELLGYMILTAQQIARDKKIADSGYRLVFNVKKHAGQLVDHIHLHLIGGQSLGAMV